MQEKDLNELQVEELIGSLCAHESLIVEDKPKKKGMTISLKSTQNTNTWNEINYLQNHERKNEEPKKHFSEDEDDLALISWRIQEMVFRKIQNRNPFQNKRDPRKAEIDKIKITCYGCNKIGHFKTECP